MRNYTESVALGHYGRVRVGLEGKLDNVRLLWEDQLTRVAAGPALLELAGRAESERRGLRVLDLGCGAGEGLELLRRVERRRLGLADEHDRVLPLQSIGYYLGLDLNEEMLAQGRANYATQPQVQFAQADLRTDLGRAPASAPFDLVFSSYGALSHLLSAADLRACLCRALGVLEPGGAVVLDLHGRYSLEWPEYWSGSPGGELVRPYSMSYLYPQGDERRATAERFPLRFWTGREIQDLVSEVAGLSGRRLEVVSLVDRSIFVGRHVDTREYDCPLPPLRGLVNRLFQQHLRTHLGDLRIEPSHWPALPRETKGFLVSMAEAWNKVIGFASIRLAGERVNLVEMPGWSDYPPELQQALMTIDRLVDSLGWIDLGDVRANMVEPQIAYVLRRLERTMQKGLGCGHGLHVVIRADR